MTFWPEMRTFSKYHSLGNDFVLFDGLDQSSGFMESMVQNKNWEEQVRHLCAPHTGVGADGVLVVQWHQDTGSPHLLIYNADGSQPLTCLNGLTVVAHHCVVHHPSHLFQKIVMGPRTYACDVALYDHRPDKRLVTTTMSPAQIEQSLCLKIDDEIFEGVCVSMGNPHYICLRCVDLDFLKHYGPKLESHAAFPHRTNVEFVWADDHDLTRFHVLVYERGCGVTNACSSGAASILTWLHAGGMIQSHTPISIQMLGGSLIGQVSPDALSMQALSTHVFSGTLV